MGEEGVGGFGMVFMQRSVKEGADSAIIDLVN
jgi:hypothetical protein